MDKSGCEEEINLRRVMAASILSLLFCLSHRTELFESALIEGTLTHESVGVLNFK